MSFIHADRGASVETRSQPIVDFKPFIRGLAALLLFVIGLRVYEQYFAWSDGLDSFSPEFQLYWMLLLKIAVFVSIASALGLTGYLWRSRDRALQNVTPAEETRRYLYLIQWLALFSIAVAVGLSFFTEQTAVWHMTAVRDTDFTPSNIMTFYIAYPLFAIIGLGAFFYAKTRLPFFARGYSLAFIVAVGGVFMTIPNVGFNEWGHTSWAMDEGFAGPLHWGFVFFGWMALGVFGVVLQILGRLKELLGADAVRTLVEK